MEMVKYMRGTVALYEAMVTYMLGTVVYIWSMTTYMVGTVVWIVCFAGHCSVVEHVTMLHTLQCLAYMLPLLHIVLQCPAYPFTGHSRTASLSVDIGV